jgi:hypothetical protein
MKLERHKKNLKIFEKRTQKFPKDIEKIKKICFSFNILVGGFIKTF